MSEADNFPVCPICRVKKLRDEDMFISHLVYFHTKVARDIAKKWIEITEKYRNVLIDLGE